jgi:hypothetical protein
MKKSLIASLLVLAVAIAAWAGVDTNPQPFTLSWGTPAGFDSNGVVRVYHSTDITVPMTNWIVLISVPGNASNTPITIIPGAHFYSGTYSNMWGEGGFSAVVSTPPLPRSDVIFSLTRGTN